MKMRIICVGRPPEMFRDAIKEYEKRIGRYCTLESMEVPEGQGPDEKARLAEGERILKLIPQGSVPILLDIGGKKTDSVAFSKELSEHNDASDTLCFIIGGATGVCDAVRSAVRKRMSFSDMTFCHPLARVMLLEQIYRGFKIMRNEPYHK